jgi:hypothetical protein
MEHRSVRTKINRAISVGKESIAAKRWGQEKINS